MSTVADRFTDGAGIFAKAGAEAQRELRDAYWAIFDTDDLIAAGIASGPKLLPRFSSASTPSPRSTAASTRPAVECLLDDRD